MSREPQTDTIEGLEVTSIPLPFSAAEPMLPDVGQFLALLIKEMSTAFEGVDFKALKLGGLDVSKLAPALAAVSAYFGEGKLTKLAPKLLAGTTVVFTDDLSGEKELKDLSKAKDRELVFDENPAAYLPVLFFAGRTTYARFFPGIARAGDAIPSGSS
jgi:hypothetical protein